MPAGVQGYDRYAYANNSPIWYTDSSGNTPENCTAFGWCTGFGPDSFTISLTMDVTKITAYLYKGENRKYSQFIDDRNGLCGAVTFAAILRTQNPSLTGNQIISELDDADIETNWTGRGNIEEMAKHFGWNAIASEPDGTALTLSGYSDDRRNKLLSFIKKGWVPMVMLKTNGGYIDGSGDTSHWVGIVGMGKNSDGWFVNVYNPVNDRVTQYSWDVFYTHLSRTWYAPRDKTHTPYTHNALIVVRPKLERVPWQIDQR